MNDSKTAATGDARTDNDATHANTPTEKEIGAGSDALVAGGSEDNTDGKTSSDKIPSAATDVEVEQASLTVVWATWEKERRSSGQNGLKQYEGGHAKLKDATSMLAIEIVHRANHDWQAEAAKLGVTVPVSQHKYMVASAVTFAGATDDTEERKSLAKLLDRQALAVEWLVGQVEVEPSTYPASHDGIAAAAALIEKGGGITRVSAIQRAKNSKKLSAKVTRHEGIVLDPDKVREVRLARAQAQLQQKAAGREFSLGIIYHEDSGLKVALEVPADGEAVETALLQVNVTEPLVDQFGELLQAGEMIAEEQTDVPRDRLDDPEDPEKGMRMAFRHFVFGHGDEVVISPILTSAAVVVLAAPGGGPSSQNPWESFAI